MCKFHNNPVYNYIENNYNDDFHNYFKITNIFVNKIGSWFLECKYNPKYKYCRDRLDKEYESYK